MTKRLLRNAHSAIILLFHYNIENLIVKALKDTKSDRGGRFLQAKETGQGTKQRKRCGLYARPSSQRGKVFNA